MRFTVTVSIVSFAAVQALSLPLLEALDVTDILASLSPINENDPRFRNHVPPGYGDVRSPCPGLNTLANHNFIHHSGKGMTIPHLIKGLAQGMNMGADFATLIGATGLLASADPLSLSFNLDDLNQHNFPTEHDVSISRPDAYFGDATAFNASVWNDYISFFSGKMSTDLDTTAIARFSRFENSKRYNPELVFGLKEEILSLAENSLLLQTMGGAGSDKADLRFVRTFIQEQKLPFELGWRPSKAPITLLTLGAMSVEILKKSPDTGNELGTVTKDSYKDILILGAGGLEILGNLTQGISETLGL
ncbi:Peroxidase-2 domain containing protein [Pyrenophora tritici-repentis]|uniref:Peroxidase-2 multi-domain protein n=2 Tax=Pyrenophora tritici-repentis TaxID=45151 RepID=A0A2W1G453_9PLEO|nr:Peroxidase-2 multi-domain protein [Pyrenophora tritici-repentis]KAF7454801.1 Peroxidase-2 multi-domain protein [Pyrenophora tritici-repentis]KAF7577933.1 Peroxidase-2 multi-domain protein [Pyrenophora tritici-repentis]KAG9388562.1 Peroxidase-2 multi-domain protein [Pyrenophora tritici-repentis]KAI0583390.1 Peroxidase-2 multi-domain protein [Pyrenophora tritici-repentis]